MEEIVITGAGVKGPVAIIVAELLIQLTWQFSERRNLLFMVKYRREIALKEGVFEKK
nr:hypothetical protein [Neobacillus sp. 179.-C4.2 HS]